MISDKTIEIKHKKSRIQSAYHIRRSTTINSMYSDSGIENIGSLDRLGNFHLNPKIKSNLETETLSYWERLKHEFTKQSEIDVMNEADNIIKDVLSQVILNHPKEFYPSSIQRFLSQ